MKKKVKKVARDETKRGKEGRVVNKKIRKRKEEKKKKKKKRVEKRSQIKSRLTEKTTRAAKNSQFEMRKIK